MPGRHQQAFSISHSQAGMTQSWTAAAAEGHLIFFRESLLSRAALPQPQPPPKLAAKPTISFSIDAILSTDYREPTTQRPHYAQTVAMKNAHSPLLLPHLLPVSAPYRQDPHRLNPYKQQHYYSNETDLNGKINFYIITHFMFECVIRRALRKMCAYLTPSFGLLLCR